MPHAPRSEHKQDPDYLYVAIACLGSIPFVLFPTLALASLQRIFQPADSLLFGATVRDFPKGFPQLTG